MVRPIIATIAFIAAFGINLANAQPPASYKNFKAFENLVPEIDFFASNRQLIAPYEKPAAEAIARLKTVLGSDLPKGAIFVCSTLEQKDAIYEPKILKMGYGWTLTAVSPEARIQEAMARIKAQMGGEVPAEILDRIKKMPQEMTANAEKQMVASITQQIAYAVLQSKLAKDFQFRSSRVEDMDKSPLPDWLDIGIASYASGSSASLAFLQQNMEQAFPIEDVLSMSRPFVASFSGQSGGGSGMGGMGRFGGGGSGGMNGASFRPQMNGQSGFSPRGMGGFGGPGGQRGGSQRTLPKDEQDRMLFDGQSSSFFSFMLERVGMDKIKELIKEVLDGKESREYISKPDVLGPDFEKIEADWVAWVKSQKPPEESFRRN
jgi:hypothetical protein